MQIPRPPHNWSVTPAQAIAIQKKLARQVKQTPPRQPLRYVAGVDAAYSRDGEYCIAAAVLWDRHERIVAEQRTALRRLLFPYIPGLLTFREAPAVIAALRKLRRAPDVLLCDGQGRAHPRRLGIACHLGVLVGLAAVGCAKSRLTGTYQEPGLKRGDRAVLRDKGEVIGTVLRTRERVKPVFVSVGHLIDLAGAEELVLDCAVGYRLPEPVRLADHLVATVKRQRSA